MPDYGHPLEFGTFVTPVNDPPERAVELAVLSEDLGYDVVTFQDHPYQPAFHDTWTLMAWTAARTSRIRVSANVHNLPLRHPAVLARSIASLDLLSSGRIDLGIGTGGFADAVAAMGGPRRTPGESIVALGEALRIIRGIWDAGERAPLRVEGEHYRVAGAKRGPAPSRDIPIWIGAYKPRMLRLVARDGDGWLPSLPYLPDGGLTDGNATLDAEATRVGRDPREIRRLLNISPADATVDRVVGLALEDGVGTFILSSDDPAVLAAFAASIPDIRERVAEERGSGGRGHSGEWDSRNS